MCEEKAIRDLGVNLQRGLNRLCLNCRIDLGGLGLDRQGAGMGLAAVVRSCDGRNTYWAAVHPGSKPDFHCRESSF
jgi:hypothetical protein